MKSGRILSKEVGYTEKDGWFYTPDAEKVREAFRIFLSGEMSYAVIGRRVGVEPFNLRIILRNPIYTGWRVIDKRRDPSPGAKRTKRDGRQGDRPKIARAPDDIIRRKVIDEPLVTESDFQRVQQMMDRKKTRHWRTRHDYEHRFTYNGFLGCAHCGEIVYTALARDDYYVCKGKRLAHHCPTGYMRRDILDPKLDDMFADRLNDQGFLARSLRKFPEGPQARVSRTGPATYTLKSTLWSWFASGFWTPTLRASSTRMSEI